MIIYTANLLKLKEKYKIIVSRSVKEKEYIHSSSDRRPPWREPLTTTSLILSMYCTMNTIKLSRVYILLLSLDAIGLRVYDLLHNWAFYTNT